MANDRFKFRAWDKWKKQMVQPHNGDFIAWHAMSNWRDCLEVMQFTGLKDKNGREIYEGDVVKTPRSTFEVYWENCSFRAGEIQAKRWAYTPELLWEVGGDYEVIGNKWENPELLNNSITEPTGVNAS